MRRGTYLLLFVALLGIFVSLPFIGNTGIARSVNVAIFLTALLLSVRAVSHSRPVLWSAVSLGVVAIVPWPLFVPGDIGRISSYLSAAGFLALVATTILRDVLRARKVTLDLLFGACCVYLLMGVMWGQVFLLLDVLQPGSFHVTEQPLGASFAPPPREAHIVYFSYVTLATIGYGDIVPLSPGARVFAVVEAILGQLYLAILVARLVSLEIAARLDAGR